MTPTRACRFSILDFSAEKRVDGTDEVVIINSLSSNSSMSKSPHL
jgi:hypothetical protein